MQQEAPIYYMNQFFTAKEIVEQYQLTWKPQDIGNLAKCSLITTVIRGNLKLFNVKDVLKLYRQRLQSQSQEAA